MKVIIKLGLLLTAFALIMGCLIGDTLRGHNAYGQQWNSDDGTNAIWSWTTSNIYQVHQVHVGDKVFVTNSDTKIHSIRGQDTAGEIFQSDAIYPGGQYEMQFLFPGNFTFYDEYNHSNFGLIEIYDPGAGFPPVTNTTTSPVTYQGTPYYSSLATDSGDSGGGSVNFGGTSNSTQITFNDSNGTQLTFDNSNGTQIIPGNNTNVIGNMTDNNTVAYWKDQATMWHSKYTDLYNNIRALLGI